jgi:geranylgeranyl diphosphate synthase, type II
MHTLDALRERVREVFRTEKFISEPRNLYEPVEYTLALGGKRVRPLLVLLGCDIFGGNIDEAIDPAIGVELFHNFTLLHDDIMDQAPLRRGKETVYKKWSINTAILSGDTMYAMAYRYVTRTSRACLPDVIRTFTDTAIEVCEGQQLDMDFETRNDVSITEYLEMIRLKTAVLLSCSLKTGALIAGADSAGIRKIGSFGENLGMAFQLRDDLLDLYSNKEKFGKETGGDILACKKTFLYLKALEMLSENERPGFIAGYADTKGDPQAKIARFRKMFDDLGIPALTNELIGIYSEKALAALNSVGADDKAREPLQKLSRILLDRDY